MKAFHPVAKGFAVRPLLEQLDAHPELWGAFGWRKDIPSGPHAAMTDIWLRYNAPEKIGKPDFNAEHDAVWYPAYEVLTEVRTLIYSLMAIVEGERLGGVLITKIAPGAGIARHRDDTWHVRYYDKFYLSLKSAPGAKFICHANDEVLEPKAGECWRYDNRQEHSVANDSDQDRITLIVCIRTRKWGSYNPAGGIHAART